ncbi:pimeloyl-ACP methyl ester carboxylesterase [Catenulispora sp. EB89]|uniref:alpha/beta fold hydrolase n=1 Tax=Catenulispora sp. EB89 TaxID=3156257 RepID=UPI003517AEAD
MATVNSVDICVETFGEPASPAILLIAGAGGSMDTWDPDFCTALAATGRLVIRYDHRDTGRSTHYPPGAPDYSFYDLLADATALIDRFAHGRAHVVGMSMGGTIAQYLAVDHPDKVAALALVSTSPIFPAGLPPLTQRLLDAYGHMPTPNWADKEATLDHLVQGARIHAGRTTFDEHSARATARRIIDRSLDLRTAGNHNAMRQEARPERDFRALLAEVAAPALVIHGTDDPMLPQEHAIALAAAIPHAELMLLEGVGHQAPPRSSWDQVITALTR